jgi:methylamine utilization protein MauE
MDPVITLGLRAAFALLFLAAAAHKLRDPRRFVATLADYRVLPAPLVPAAAAAVVAVELGLAGLVPLPGAAGLRAGAALLLVYAGAIAANLVRGRRHIDCGCLGVVGRRSISWWLVGRNVAFAALALAGTVPVRERVLVWVDGLTVAAAVASAAALHAATVRLAANLPRAAALRGGA